MRENTRKSDYMRPVIIGFDPGLTSAFAVIGLNGEVLTVNSDREFTFPDIKDQILKIGKPILLAIDKASVGTSAERLASSFGCKIYKPEKDMLVEDKEDITSDKRYNNDHERDALAAALAAYRSYERLFSKIDTILISRDLGSFSDDVKCMVLEKRAKNIDEAMDKVLDIEQIEETIEKEPEKKIDWEGIAKALRRKVKESKRHYDILKIYTEKLEKKLETLERQKQKMLEEEREKNMEARKEIMKEKDIKSKDILIKQLQFELNKQRDMKMAYERKVSREEEAKQFEEDGCIPVIPVEDFDADMITEANIEFGINDQVVWFKNIKPSKRAARAIMALNPRLIIGEFNDEIREMLENAHLKIIEDVDVEMGNFYAAVSEREIKNALKDTERNTFVDWLSGYKKRFI